MFGSFDPLPDRKPPSPPNPSSTNDADSTGYSDDDFDLDFESNAAPTSHPTTMPLAMKNSKVKEEIRRRKQRQMIDVYASPASKQGAGAKIVSKSIKDKSLAEKKAKLSEGKKFMKLQQNRKRKIERKEEAMKKKQMEKLRETMNGIERGRWEEIKVIEEKRRKAAARAATQPPDSSQVKMSKKSLGGYVGSSTKPSWVGVLDTPTVVPDPVAAKTVQLKSVERKARIKTKSKTSSKQAPASHPQHPHHLTTDNDDSNSVDSDNVGADILLAEDSYASSSSPEYETTPAPLSAMSDKSSFSISQGAGSSSSLKRSPTPRSKKTSSVNSALKKKVVEVEKLVQKMMDLKEKELKASQKTKAQLSIKRKESPPKRTAPQLSLPLEITSPPISTSSIDYGNLDFKGRATPTQRKLAMREVEKIMGEEGEEYDEDYDDEKFEEAPRDPERIQAEILARQAYNASANAISSSPTRLVTRGTETRVKHGLVNSPGRIQITNDRMEANVNNLAQFVMPPSDFPGLPKRIQDIAEREFRMEEYDRMSDDIEEDFEDPVEIVKGVPPLTMFTQGREKVEDEEEEESYDGFSIVDMFAKELARQKEVEMALTLAAEEPTTTTKDLEDSENFSDDEAAMMAIKNTKDVMEGKPVKLEIQTSSSASPKTKSPKSKSPAKSSRSPSKSPSRPPPTPNAASSFDEDDYNDDEFEQAETSQLSESNNNNYNNISSADFGTPRAQDPPLSQSQTTLDSSTMSSSFSSSYESTNDQSNDFSTTLNSRDESTTTPRLTPAELQAKLLKELALSDALTEQLLQLNEIEKTYTIATANAETAKVASTFQKHREEQAMAEEIRAQQQAFELTLQQAVASTREQLASTARPPPPQQQEDSSHESVTPLQTPSKPMRPPQSLERSTTSYSAYSEDFDVDDSQVSRSSVSEVNKGEFGNLQSEHAAAFSRRQKEDERLLAVREQAIREVYNRQLRVLENSNNADAKQEKKRLRRQKAAALAAINQERWALKGKGYRDEEMFSRLWNDEAPFMAPFHGEGQLNVFNVGNPTAPTPYGYNNPDTNSEMADETMSQELQSSAADDSQVGEMKRKLDQLKRRKAAAEKLIAMKKKRSNISEEVRKTQKLTEQLEREAMLQDESNRSRRGRSRERSRSIMSQGTEGDGYLSDSFESFDGDNKSVRSNRSGRSRSITRRDTTETIEFVDEMVQENDESSEFMSSVEDDEQVEKEDAAMTVEEEEVQLSSEQRKENYARSRQSLVSEVSEGPSYAMESFESFSDAGTGNSRSRRGLEGRERGEGQQRGGGVGAGLQIDVPAGANDIDPGTLTMGSGPVSRQSSFGGEPRKRNNHSRSKNVDKENLNDGKNLSDDNNELDTSMESIKNRVRGLQKQVDIKNKAQRRAEEKRRLMELEIQLKNELAGVTLSTSHVQSEVGESVASSRRSARSGRSKSPAASGRGRGRGEEVSMYQASEASASASGPPGRLSVSPGPSLSASALSNSGFGREISGVEVAGEVNAIGGPSFNTSGNGVGLQEFIGVQDEDNDDVESAVLSDSFRSRSSGGGSDSDDEAAVRRTERRMRKFKMAVRVQARMRGMLARIRVNHRRAVIERMVRKARHEEREALEFKRWGLTKGEGTEGGGQQIEDESFDVGGEDTDASNSTAQSLKVSTEDDISRMVATALAAAQKFGVQSSPTPGMETSFVSGTDTSTDSDDIAQRVELALYEDSFASGFGEGSADIEGLLSSMASEHAENLRIGEQATGAAIEAVANVAVDLVVQAMLEEVFVSCLEEKSVGSDVQKREMSATAVQKVVRGKSGRRKSLEMMEVKQKEVAAVKLQKVSRGKKGRRKSLEMMEVKQKEVAAVKLQAHARSKIAKMVAGQKMEVKKREEAERVKASIEERATKEAEVAAARIKERKMKELEERQAKELKERQAKLKEREIESDKLSADFLEDLVQAEIDLAVKARRVGLEARKDGEEVVEEKVEDIDDMGDEPDSFPPLRGQMSIPMSGDGEDGDFDDDLYDFDMAGGGSDLGGGGNEQQLQLLAQQQAQQQALDYDWDAHSHGYLNRIFEHLDFDKLTKVFGELEDERVRIAAGGKKRKKKKKEGKFGYIVGIDGVEEELDVSASESSIEFDLSGSLGSAGGDESGIAGSLGWGENDEVLPLTFFIALEMKIDTEIMENIGVSKSSRQMRNKAIFDLLHEVIKKKLADIYVGGGRREERAFAVVGSLAASVPGPGAEFERRVVKREEVERNVRLVLNKGKVDMRSMVREWGVGDSEEVFSENNLYNLALSAQDEGISPYLILAGVYDKEGGGDEEWGLEAEEGEEEVKESVVSWLFEKLVEEALDDMLVARKMAEGYALGKHVKALKAPSPRGAGLNVSVESIEDTEGGGEAVEIE